ncbi:endonuclease/exonuclease/phosphatase family protein [Streptomyces erythrochromogenes]|uniref:endonuclease/exonuclease/phosphatase family protein n=1 Tax=Streptomyces erythrochromogenes TaxID=285574 RepID=UPI00224E4D9B|nr:endonuclease/exonuclease/phosphatase family protein [Streptomyces erythrochromogenes]MCX5588755.1 endonuclease/exonuclease/phosphatase family protein [Streptomyces erythrochromogenes]
MRCVHSREAIVLSRGARWVAAAMTAVCLVLLQGAGAPNGGLLFARPLQPDAAEAVVPGRVGTWNICNPCGSGNDFGRATEIATYAPQLIALQEACVRDVERIRRYLEEVYGLTYRVEYGTVLRNWNRCGGLPWRPGGYGQAILSAAPMTDRVSVEYPVGGSEDRGFLAVTTLVDGRPVRVFNTHLAERRQGEVRAGQIEVLAAEVARHDRAIVLGDFNAVPHAPELATMWALAPDTDPGCRPSTTDADADAGADADACTTTTDWDSTFDYVFLRGITSGTDHVRPSPYSDHHLLYTDLNRGRGVSGRR